MTSHSAAKAAAATGLGIAVTVLYSITAARTIVFIDSGELATVAWTLGIAHPTGYPLYTLIAWMAAHFPAGLTPVFKVNLLSAVFSSAGIVMFFLLACRFIGRELAPAGRSPRTGADAPRRRGGGMVVVSALFGSLSLACSATWWTGSAAVEVYPLHALFLVILIPLFLSAFPRGRGEERGGEPPHSAAMPHIFAYVLGLSFSNHMSTIYLAPAFLLLYFRRRGAGRESLLRLLTLAPAFLLGLSAYLYLPVRASAGPVMDWGNPVEPGAILRHLSGRQYSVWIFSSAGTAARQLAYFFRTLGSEFSYVPLALSLWGMRFLYRRSMDLFLLVLLLFAGCLAFAVNYDINDIDSYFLLAYVATALAAAVGIHAILLSAGRGVRAAVMVVAGLSVGWQAAGNFPVADQSGLRVVEQYARSILEGADRGGLVLSYQWDYFVSASYYLQIVAGVRPDVIVVDKELLRRTWYLGYLRRRYPGLLDGLERETSEYLRELTKFERGLPYDPATIESRYTGLIAGIIARHRSAHAVYVTPEIEPAYTAGYRRVPHGLTFELRTAAEDDAWSEVPVVIDPPDRGDRYVDAITTLAARAELGEARYLGMRGMSAEAVRAARRSLAIRPDDAEARVFLRESAK